MKPSLHPSNTDFKRAELFDGTGDSVGIRFVQGQATERFTQEEWDEIIADVRERFAAKRARDAA